MKIVSLVFEIVETLSLENSATIKIAEFEKELRKYGFSIDDLEAGFVLYHIVRYLLSKGNKVTIDFEGVYIPYDLVNESLTRLSYEHGKMIHKIIRVINVDKDSQEFIQACMNSYITTIINTAYTDANSYAFTETEPHMAVA